MVDYIIREIEKFLDDKNFQGHVRFGIERSNVVSLSVSSKVEIKNNVSYSDIIISLQSLFKNNKLFGSIEFDIYHGEICQFNWAYSFQGADLKERLSIANM